MEIYPVGFVDVPAALAVDHVAVGGILRQLHLLSIYHVLRQVHLVSVLGFIEGYIEAGAGYRGRLGLKVAILDDFIGVKLLLLLTPLLILERSEEEVGLSEESERYRLVDVDLFLPSEPRKRSSGVPESV